MGGSLIPLSRQNLVQNHQFVPVLLLAAMFSLSEKISNTSKKWFGKSDAYTNVYLLYMVLSVLPLDGKFVSNRRIFLAVVRPLQFTILISYTYCFFAYIVELYLQRQDLDRFTLGLTYAAFFVVSASRVVLSALNRHGLQATVDRLDNNLYLDHVGTSEASLKILTGAMRKYTSLVKLCANICTFGNFFRMLTRISGGGTLIPVPFLDVQQPRAYFAMYIVDLIGLNYLMAAYLFHEMTVTGIFGRIQYHFFILEKNILEVNELFSDFGEDLSTQRRNSRPRLNTKLQNKVFEMLRRNVIHHQEILKTVKAVNSVFRGSFLINVFGSGSLLVIMFFQLTLKSDRFTAVFIICQAIYLFGGIVDIFLVCFYGSQIKHASDRAARALFSNPWLKMDKRNRAMLRFFQMALWKEPVIKTSMGFSLDLKFFVSFLQSIYTYLAFAQKAMNREQ